jgi:L-2-hydroxyglutarate oxidase LhgO
VDGVDAVVIGAGVVGLAVARALAQAGLETLLVERENAIGTATSSRNSEVIHAGLYYAQGSLKARLCVRGREQLYDYCASHGIAHRRCGKLVVATAPAEVPGLAQLAARARANGVSDLQLLSADEARALEPALACQGALLSPSTGIVDSHGLMLALQGDFERAGGAVALCSPVLALRCDGSRHEIEVGGDEPMTLAARIVVNAAGLHAPALARATSGLAARHVPRAPLSAK